jgi:hypothetical protein
VDEDGTPGQALLLDKQGQRVRLSWGDSCTLTATDYAVYRGTFDPSSPGDNTFTNHEDLVCTTHELNSHEFIEEPGSFYYLVVPHNGTWEGSYGTNSGGTERPQGRGGFCFPQTLGSCHGPGPAAVPASSD